MLVFPSWQVLGASVAAGGLIFITLQTCEPAEALFYTKVAMPALRLLDPEACAFWPMAAGLGADVQQYHWRV
jgi:hypothetical protein